MARNVMLLAAVACGGVEGIRRTRSSKLEQQQEPTFAETGSRSCDVPAQSQIGEPGQVDFMYSFGAPATGSPALRNPRSSDGCFPGLRVWLTNGRGYWGQQRWTDGVAGILNTHNYWHSLTDIEDIKEDLFLEDGFESCHSSLVGRPNSPWLSARLHRGDTYVQLVDGKLCDRWSNATFFGRTGNMQDPAQLARDAVAMGWRKVGESLENVHAQAHLFQDPATHECIVTFMGTDGTAEWIGNTNLRPAHFCGYTYEDESCQGVSGTCPVRKEGGGFTHMGFTNRLRNIVRSDAWRTKILNNLDGCSKVYAVGHSAGGAMASLFQSCVAMAPQPGEFGYDSDYQYMQWTRGESRQLPYLPI